MKRLVGWVGVNVLVVVLLAGAAWFWFRPSPVLDGIRHPFANVTSQFVSVSYRPGAADAMVSVRLNGLSRYHQVEYRVASSEAWAPQWQAHTEGQLSEFLTLTNGHSKAPQPMTRELGEQLARSYKIVLRLDGEERTFDFSQAAVAESTPLLSINPR